MMLTTLTTYFTAIVTMFSEFFAVITTSPVVEWIMIGVAIAVISFVIGVFKRLVWGQV